MSRHFALRRAAIACIRQISQKEANEICEAGSQTSGGDQATTSSSVIGKLRVESADRFGTDGGPHFWLPLEAILFSLLDVETDARLRRDIEESITSLMQARGIHHLSDWLKTLKQLIEVCSLCNYMTTI